MHTHTCIPAHIHTQYIHTYSHAYKYMHVCIHTHAHACTHTLTDMHTYIHTYPQPYRLFKLKVNRLQVPGPIFCLLCEKSQCRLLFLTWWLFLGFAIFNVRTVFRDIIWGDVLKFWLFNHLLALLLCATTGVLCLEDSRMSRKINP